MSRFGECLAMPRYGESLAQPRYGKIFLWSYQGTPTGLADVRRSWTSRVSLSSTSWKKWSSESLEEECFTMERFIIVTKVVQFKNTLLIIYSEIV